AHALDDIQQSCAVTLQFYRAHPAHRTQLLSGAWPAPRDFLEGGVVEHRVGGYTVLACHLQPPRTQRLKQTPVSAVVGGNGGAACELPRCPGGCHPRAIYRAAAGSLEPATIDGAPHPYGPLAAQHLAAGRYQPQHAVALGIDMHQAQHHELAEHRPPLCGIEIRPDAEGAQAVVAELLDFCGAAAA